MKYKANDKLEFEILSLNHKKDLKKFDCGDEGLNNFIKKGVFVPSSDPAKVRGTTTIVKLNNNIVGYYTLKNSSLLFNPNNPDDDKKKYTKDYFGIPAIEITYLAVDKKFQRQGNGSTILQNIFFKSYEHSRNFSKILALIVSSLEDKVEFYEKNNFQVITDFFELTYDKCRNTTEKMFLYLSEPEEQNSNSNSVAS